MRATWEYFVAAKLPDLTSHQINKILKEVDWDTWLYESALAPVELDFTTPESDQAVSLALEYIALNGTASPPGYDAYLDFYSNLKIVFQDTLAANIDQLNIEILTKIDADYNCTGDPNPRVKARWYPTCLELRYEHAYDGAHSFISSMGRAYYL